MDVSHVILVRSRITSTRGILLISVSTLWTPNYTIGSQALPDISPYSSDFYIRRPMSKRTITSVPRLRCNTEQRHTHTVVPDVFASILKTGDKHRYGLDLLGISVPPPAPPPFSVVTPSHRWNAE